MKRNRGAGVGKYLFWRLARFLIRRKGRHLRAGELERWSREFFEALGSRRLRGSIRYPRHPFPGDGAKLLLETPGSLCEEKPHARFETGLVETHYPERK